MPDTESPAYIAWLNHKMDTTDYYSFEFFPALLGIQHPFW